MFMFLIAVVVGIILFKLGVLSVLVAVLGTALKAAILVIGILGIFMLWLQHRKP